MGDAAAGDGDGSSGHDGEAVDDSSTLLKVWLSDPIRDTIRGKIDPLIDPTGIDAFEIWNGNEDNDIP